MTPEEASTVYDILVRHAGAPEDDRDAFVYHLTDGCTEWRFQGALGFGGKFYVERCGWRVGAYPEDIARDPSRQAAIDNTHAALQMLWALS